jgi:hypothetical protein
MFFCQLAGRLAKSKAATAPLLIVLSLCLLIATGSNVTWSANPSNKQLQGAFQPNEVVKAVTYCPDCVQSAFTLPIGKKAAGVVKDWTTWPLGSQIYVSATEEFWPRSTTKLDKPGGKPIWLVFRSILL